MILDRTFFITTVTWQRTPLFRNPPTAELMMDILGHYREQKKYLLHEYVRVCFGGNPQYAELQYLLRILLAAKFIRREGEYFRTTPDVNLVEIDRLEVERVLAQVQYFYQKYSQELYDALPDVAL